MPMDGCMKFFSPQSNAGVSQEKGVAIMSQTIAVSDDYDSNVKKNIIKP